MSPSRIAYIDAKAGAAGDMLLAALLDAGAAREDLEQGLRSIRELEGEWRLDMRRVIRSKGHIAANHVKVSSAYDHRPVPAGGASQRQEEPHRSLADIRSILLSAEALPAPVRGTSIKVFTALAQAESEVHGIGIEDVHFHEVGAVDSIIDTVGVVLALHLLGVDRVYSSPLPFGEGVSDMTAHGILSVPTPATLRLMLGIPTIPGPPGATGELMTPTGCSLIKVLAEGRFGQAPPFTPERLGIGAGDRDYDTHANVVRVIIGTLNNDPILRHSQPHNFTAEPETSLSDPFRPPPPPGHFITAPTLTCSPTGLRHPMLTSDPTERPLGPPGSFHVGRAEAEEASTFSHGDWEERRLCKLEANLDDMTPETASFALDRLLEERGCLDAWYTPAVMKKGRPGLTLHLLCEPKAAPPLLRRIFLETPTLGVRAHVVERLALQRDFMVIPTIYGDMRAKIGRMEGVVVNVKPEHEDCRNAALSLRVPLRAVIEETMRVAREHLQKEAESSRREDTVQPSSAVEEAEQEGGSFQAERHREGAR